MGRITKLDLENCGFSNTQEYRRYYELTDKYGNVIEFYKFPINGEWVVLLNQKPVKDVQELRACLYAMKNKSI